MKRLTTYLLLLLLAAPALAQEKPPTKEEMDKMMKEMQKELNNMDPETKRMMDSMGIKMPDMKKTQQKLSGVTDAQLKEAWDDENRIVPKRDAARIAAIPGPVSSGGMGSYITSRQAQLFAKLQPAVRTVGDKVYASFKAGGNSSAKIGNAAAALWMTGRTQTAFYLMSRACADDPSNADNLGNYAAMLSMMGAEQLAIPILNNLNSRFPRNATILNNLGQAWFGLGELGTSEKYLDSTIRIFGAHTQANVTKAKIQESKGNKTEAANLVKKSIQTAYSQDKDAYLTKLGFDLSSIDLRIPKPTKADPLNLGSFNPPAFPMSVAECVVLEPQWKEFDNQLEKGMAVQKALQLHNVDANKSITDVVNRIKNRESIVPLHLEAGKKGLRDAEETWKRKLDALGQELKVWSEGAGNQLRLNYEKTMKELKKQDNDQTGEGKRNEDFCPRYRKVSDEYVKAVNSFQEDWYKRFLMVHKVYYNEIAYFGMFTMFEQEYESYKPGIKGSWLFTLKNSHNIKFITDYTCGGPKPEAKAGGKLAEFDDINCQYHSKMKYVVGTIEVDCSKMTTTLDLGDIKLGLKQNMDMETFADQFVSCTVAVSAGVGTKVGGAGPLEIGVGADVTGILEIDRSGVKDVIFEGSVGVSAGTTIISDAGKATTTGSKTAGHGVSDGSASVGLEGRISLISGARSGGFNFGSGGGFK
ncbi:MAG: hypothetical protein JST68_17225 [Bacteroidetes bacterium]|nr:hypothetical protein [Bacteroidota bacterium]